MTGYNTTNAISVTTFSQHERGVTDYQDSGVAVAVVANQCKATIECSTSHGDELLTDKTRPYSR